MNLCSICNRRLEGPRLTLEPGNECHPACFARRGLEDAMIALIAATVLVLAPPIIVWAG